jgi:thiol-disulfide isomerase/thioredoxin
MKSRRAAGRASQKKRGGKGKRTHRRTARIPKTARGHQQSSIAKMFPPIDVQSKEDIAKAIKQIMAGPVTILLVYADWCGHCHEIMPHWDAAAKSPGRTVPSIKLNEKATESFNAALRNLNQNESSIHVSGYPTVLVLDNKGNKITNVEAKKDTESLTQLMNRSGPLAEKAGLSQPQVREFSRPQPPSYSQEAQEAQEAQEEQEEGLATQGMRGDVAASLEPLSLPLASPPRRVAEPVTGGAHYRKGGLYRILHPQTHKNRR